MEYFYHSTKIFYKLKKGKNIVNIFLHGWERDCDDFKKIISNEKIDSYLLVDFPPFGKSGEPFQWNIFTYVNMLISLIEYLEIKEFNLIGHSFGGRIAIILASIKKETKKLILLDSAGMKPKFNFKKYISVKRYKIQKRLNRNVKNFGSEDYRKLSSNMKETFKTIVNTHLEDFAKQIRCSTLIINGEKDTETPMYMAIRLNKLIKNSRLKRVENSGHFCFIDREFYVGKIINEFLEEK